eukprot:TRINITY_DN9197_c0_g1_i1.p1 TRINITY_DN9197_c0_g1~~TRINITY_DN9197_c0_g1_i1.p1  ORF type:complete len:483 (+),score=85.11 TRINITY_DN9197_c0_g1_i1:207-1655(+)
MNRSLTLMTMQQGCRILGISIAKGPTSTNTSLQLVSTNPLIRKITSLFKKKPKPPEKRPKIIILGTGWAGYRLAKSIDTDYYDVVVVSTRNFFLFTPLLASTTVGTLEFRSIIEPIRTSKLKVEYVQAECTNINPESKTISCKSALHQNPFSMSYDGLVVAVGAEPNTFGIPGVKEHAYFLKELNHARLIRQRIIQLFELASVPDITPIERRQLLNILVVGAGATGIEFCAELNDFFLQDVTKLFPKIPVNEVKITLLEAGNTILTQFDEKLAKQTMKWFRRTGIDVKTGSLVKEVKQNEVILSDGTVLPCGIVVWTAGIAARPFIKEKVPLPKDKNGRIIVDHYLRVQGQNGIWALGDCATVEDMHLPATAQVAQQQGIYLANQLNFVAMSKAAHSENQQENSIVEQSTTPEFAFHNLGMLAYIGKYKSIFDTEFVKFSGFTAWLGWRSAYFTRLGTIKGKLQVPIDWTKTFIFGRDVTNF